MSNDLHGLQPKLDEAQRTLATALEEACSTDLERADTGELIRIEEVLAIANEAAKEVVSVRRRLGGDQPADPAPVAPPEPRPQSSAAPRTFQGEGGVTWTAFAVYPSPATANRASLRGTFQYGWLAFDSGAETRRFTPVPDNWTALSDTELCELCERAERARRRPRRGGSGPTPHAGG